MKIGINFDYNGRGIKQAKGGIASLGKSFIKGGLAITGATMALRKLNQVMKDSVQAAIADEKAQANLNKVLTNSGFGSATGQVTAFIDKMQLATGVSEDQLRPAFTQLFNSLGSVTKAQESLTVAMDVSAATGKSLSSVTAALAKAASGSKTAISRLGIGIDAAKLKTMSYDQILAELTKKFSGSAATAADTMAGKFARIKTAVSEAKEEIGKGLMDALTMVAGGMTNGMDGLQQKIIDIGTTFGDFFRGLGVLWTKMKDSPVIKFFFGDLPDWAWQGAFGSIVELGKQWRLESARLHADDARENRRLTRLNEQTKKDNKKKLETTKKITAEQKKQAQLKKLEAKYDLELIGLAAALGRKQSTENRNRLEELFQIAAARAGVNIAMDGMVAKAPNASLAMGAGMTVAGQSLAQGMAAGLSLADATAGARYAGQGAAQYYGTNPVGANVVVNLNGPTIGSDVDAVVLDAMNKAMRSGGQLRGNLVAL